MKQLIAIISLVLITALLGLSIIMWVRVGWEFLQYALASWSVIAFYEWVKWTVKTVLK